MLRTFGSSPISQTGGEKAKKGERSHGVPLRESKRSNGLTAEQAGLMSNQWIFQLTVHQSLQSPTCLTPRVLGGMRTPGTSALHKKNSDQLLPKPTARGLSEKTAFLFQEFADFCSSSTQPQ